MSQHSDPKGIFGILKKPMRWKRDFADRKHRGTVSARFFLFATSLLLLGSIGVTYFAHDRLYTRPSLSSFMFARTSSWIATESEVPILATNATGWEYEGENLELPDLDLRALKARYEGDAKEDEDLSKEDADFEKEAVANLAALEDAEVAPSTRKATQTELLDWGWRRMWDRNCTDGESRWCDTAQTLTNQIYANQHPADCKAAKFLVYTDHPSSLASMIHMRATMLGYAMHLGRVLVARSGAENRRPMYRYVSQQDCSAQDFECFFEPLTTCEMAAIDKRSHIHVPSMGDLKTMSATMAHRRVLEIKNYNVRGWVLTAMWDTRLLPSVALNQGYQSGRSFATSVRTRYVTRPNQWLRKKLSEVVEEVRLPHPIVSVQVVRGEDRKELMFRNFDMYMAKVEKLNVKNVFLGTEDLEVLKKELPKYEKQGYHFQYVKSKRVAGSDEQAVTTSRGLMYFQSLYFASHCDAWVGTLRSDFCQLINDVRSRNGQSYIDLDNLHPDHSLW